jgi:heat-inducible transcriptional repressor
VDHMLSEERHEVEEMKSVLLEKQDKLDAQLKQIARLLASNTQYASIVSTPSVRQNKIKFIQLSQVDPANLLAVIVIEGNLIRNTLIPVGQELNQEQLLKLNLLLNTNLCGLAVADITLGLIEQIKRNAGIHTEIIGNVIDAAAQIVHKEEDLQIYTSGANNIFKYPELADNEKASEIISDFEEKQVLGTIVRERLSDTSESGIQVYIGKEMPVAGMQDCSVVTANYDLGDGIKGMVGIVGPKRMDYEKVVGVVRDIMRQLDELYKKS